TVDIDRDRAHRPVLHLVVEAAGGGQFVELASPLRNFEPFVVDLLEPMIAREIVGSVAAEENVGSVLEQLAREADRRPRRPEAGDSPGPAGASIHDRRVKLDAAGRGEHTAAT